MTFHREKIDVDGSFVLVWTATRFGIFVVLLIESFLVFGGTISTRDVDSVWRLFVDSLDKVSNVAVWRHITAFHGCVCRWQTGRNHILRGRHLE